MRKVALYNEKGQQLTEVNINAEENEQVDGIQWGGSTFLWDEKLQHYRIATLKPAILRKGGKK